MSDPEIHIAAWERAGLIDAPTAARLRAAPATPGQPADAPVTSGPSADDRPIGRVSTLFGPPLTIGEVFAYVGAAFVLAGWTAWITRVSEGRPAEIGLGAAVAAAALVALALGLRGGSDRRRRGAGVALAQASLLIGVAGLSFANAATVGGTAGQLVVGSLVAVTAAIAFRRLLPAVVTQLGMLLAATTLAATTLSWLRDVVFPSDIDPYATGVAAPAAGAVDPLVLAVLEAFAWIGVAVLFGIIGLREARSDDPGAWRRAAASRVWAGLTVVVGVATAVSRSTLVWNPTGQYYYTGRAIEPWLADVAILLVSAVLVERAFRREASAYVLAAALGVVIAATDLNFTYLADSRELGLLIEGGILLAGGYAAERLRRRIAGSSLPPTIDPPPSVAVS